MTEKRAPENEAITAGYLACYVYKDTGSETLGNSIYD